MQPQPQRILPERRITRGYYQTPNFIIENADSFTATEFLFLSVTYRRGPGSTISDETWEKWTALSPRMKDHAIMGLRQKGLQVKGQGKSATYHLDEQKCQGWISSHSRQNRARTAGRSKSVTAKAGMQVHPDCKERGCSRLCQPAQIIPFAEKPVSQNYSQVEENTKERFSHPPPESPPPKGGFPLTLKAVQHYFPHADENFVRKLCTAVGEKTKYFTDAQLAQVVHAAKKRNQESEGLFLHTVPARYAATQNAHQREATAKRAQELQTARQILSGETDPLGVPWTEKDRQWARDKLRE